MTNARSAASRQAGAAARVLDTQPERAREAMRAVEETGRQTARLPAPAMAGAG